MSNEKTSLHPKDTLKLLAEQYPQTFFSDGRQVIPLAVGLIQDLLAEKTETLPDVSARAIRQAVRFYTQAISYHRAILAGKKRINLRGEAVSEISEDEKTHAQARLDEIAAVHPDKIGKPKRKGAPKKRQNKPQQKSKSPATTDKLSQLQSHFNRS